MRHAISHPLTLGSRETINFKHISDLDLKLLKTGNAKQSITYLKDHFKNVLVEVWDILFRVCYICKELK